MEHSGPREVTFDQTLEPELEPSSYATRRRTACGHAPPPALDHRDWFMYMAQQCLSKFLEAVAHSLRRGQPLQLESAVRSGFPTHVSESEEVECRRLCKSLLGARHGPKTTDLEHARLDLVQRQSEMGESYIHVRFSDVGHHVKLCVPTPLLGIIGIHSRSFRTLIQ